MGFHVKVIFRAGSRLSSENGFGIGGEEGAVQNKTHQSTTTSNPPLIAIQINELHTRPNTLRQPLVHVYATELASYKCSHKCKV